MPMCYHGVLSTRGLHGRASKVRYCITGGSGFIGRYFCEALAAAGHEITVLDLVAPSEGLPHDRFVQGDVRDPAACRAALEGCDRLLNLAAAHHDFGIERETYFSVNDFGVISPSRWNLRSSSFHCQSKRSGGVPR